MDIFFLCDRVSQKIHYILPQRDNELLKYQLQWRPTLYILQCYGRLPSFILKYCTKHEARRYFPVRLFPRVQLQPLPNSVLSLACRKQHKPNFQPSSEFFNLSHRMSHPIILVIALGMSFPPELYLTLFFKKFSITLHQLFLVFIPMIIYLGLRDSSFTH